MADQTGIRRRHHRQFPGTEAGLQHHADRGAHSLKERVRVARDLREVEPLLPVGEQGTVLGVVHAAVRAQLLRQLFQVDGLLFRQQPGHYVGRTG